MLIEEDRLDYDAATRTLTLAGAGSRKSAAKVRQVEALMPAVIELLRETPLMSGNQLDGAIKSLIVSGDLEAKHSKGDGARAANLLAKQGLVTSEPGPRNSTVFSVSSLSSLNLPEGKSGTSLTPPKGREVTQGTFDLDASRGKS